MKHTEKLTWQAFSEFLFRFKSIDFQVNSDLVLYWCFKKTHSNWLQIQVVEPGNKKTDFMCSKFLKSSAACFTSLHSNSFYSVYEENSASSKVDALLSASFKLVEKVVNIFNSFHMEKKKKKKKKK